MSNSDGEKVRRASKLGRKGDERMHRSLQVRLSNPEISLLDALVKGGFRFTTDENGNTVDADKVQLSQRKNQLSRRMRLYRQQSEHKCHHLFTGDYEKLEKNKKDEPNKEMNNEVPSPPQSTHFNSENFDRKIPTDSENSKNPIDEIESSGPNLMDDDDQKFQRALDSFQADIAALIKRSMLRAGFCREETEECDDAYLKFIERALEGESRRLRRIRSRLQSNISITSRAASSDNNNNIYNKNHLHDKTFNNSDHNYESQPHQQPGTANNYNENQLSKYNQSTKNETFSYDMNNSTSFLQPRKNCIHTRHRHRLEGKCGHKAILHKPQGGNPHIDFVVDGKIECYQNFQPLMDDAAVFWPSKFKCNNQIDKIHNSGINTSETTDKCTDICTQAYDPEILDMKEIDLTGGEWKRIFSEDGESFDDEAALGSLLKLSDL